MRSGDFALLDHRDRDFAQLLGQLRLVLEQLHEAVCACQPGGPAADNRHSDLDSLVDKSYSIQGTASHDHPFTLTAANLARLKAGQTITVVTTGLPLGPVAAHTHDVDGGSCA